MSEGDPVNEITWVDWATVCILGGQLLVLVVAAGVAYYQVREARDLREQQIRPFVVVDFVADHFMFFLAIANIGNALAKNVTISIEPELRSSLDDAEDKVSALRILNEGIPTLPPGKTIRTLFDSSISRKPEEGFPNAYVAVVAYADQDERRHFRETMDLDLGIYWGTVPSERKDVHDLHKPLVEISKTLDKWTASGGGLLRVSPAELRERFEKWRQERADRLAAREEDAGPGSEDIAP